jgi:hypothetical protein
LEGLKGHDLAFLLGVAVQRIENGKVIKEIYKRDFDDFLLATPKYLTHEMGILTSHRSEEDEEVPEFFIPEEEEDDEKKRCPKVEAASYIGEGLIRGEHIKGDIYEFFYRTRWGLSLKGDSQVMPPGTALLLYNIIKFNLDSLIDFLETRGLKAPTRSIETHDIGEGDEKHVYAVFAVVNS